MAQKNSRTRFIVFGAGAVVVICLGCIAVGVMSSLFSSTSSPVSESQNLATRTPIPTATPTNITAAEISKNRSDMTEIQWDEYEKTLQGIRVHWQGRITQISDDETIYLDCGQDFFHSVFLKDVPKDTLINLNKDQTIEFYATVQNVTTFLGLTIWLGDSEIVSIK